MNKTIKAPVRAALPVSLIALALFDMALVCVIAIRYSYAALTTAEAAAAFLLLASTAVFLWLYLVRADRAPAPAIRSGLLVGLVLGLLWVVEIGTNNFIAPPLPARDIVDNVFWAVIALAIFILATSTAYRTDSVRRGVAAGAWSGLASGLLACTMALCVVVFAMPFLTRDPLNVAEWAGRGPNSPAPSMAAFFAFETLAGGFMHLVVLGLGMGALLGIAGGAVGKIGRRTLGLPAETRTPPPER